MGLTTTTTSTFLWIHHLCLVLHPNNTGFFWESVVLCLIASKYLCPAPHNFANSIGKNIYSSAAITTIFYFLQSTPITTSTSSSKSSTTFQIDGGVGLPSFDGGVGLQSYDGSEGLSKVKTAAWDLPSCWRQRGTSKRYGAFLGAWLRRGTLGVDCGVGLSNVEVVWQRRGTFFNHHHRG